MSDASNNKRTRKNLEATYIALKITKLNDTVKLVLFRSKLHSLDIIIFCSFSVICHSRYMYVCLKSEKIHNVGVC